MNTCHVMRDSSGLSLVELMIVLVLSLFLVASVYLNSQSSRHTNNEQHTIMTMQQDLRAVMDMMEDDIHNAGCDPMLVNDPTAPVFGLKTADASQLTFTFDRNKNGTLEPADEQITYRLTDETLNRCTYTGALVEIPVPILNNVSVFTFTYLDPDGNTTANLTDISTINLHVVVADPTHTYHRELDRRVQLRNMRF